MDAWHTEASKTLELACETFAKRDLRNVILLLDQAVGVMTLGRAHALGLLPVNARRTEPIPNYLRVLRRVSADPLTGSQLAHLRKLHGLRNTIMHNLADHFEITGTRTQELIDVVSTVADQWSVRIRRGLRIAAPTRAAIELLIDPSAEWGPDHFSPDQRQSIMQSLEARGMIAGFVTNLEWPVVRCDVCDRCAPPEFLSTGQDSWLDCAYDAVPVYCQFGCGARHQDVLRQVYPADYVQNDYYLQDFVDLLFADMRACTPNGCEDCGYKEPVEVVTENAI